MINGLKILNNLICDNYTKTSTTCYLTIDSISLTIGTGSTDEYKCTYKYNFYTKPHNRSLLLFYSLDENIPNYFNYKISGDTDTLIVDCYDNLKDNFDISSIIYNNSEYPSLLSGLTSVWCFDETNTNLDIVHDIYGNMDGQNSGVTINQTGKIKKSYKTTSSNNYYISVDNDTEIHSLSIWFYNNVSINKNTSMYLIGFEQSGNNDYFGIRFGNVTSSLTDEIISIYNDTSPFGVCGWCNSSSSINIGWHHLVLTWDNNKYNITLDNSSKTISTAGTPTILKSSFKIFNRWVPLNTGFNGNIDQLAIWDRKLTTSEITKLYNSGNGYNFKYW